MNKEQALAKIKDLEKETAKLKAIIEAPEDLFSKIKTYKQVCKELGEKELTENDFNFLPKDRIKKVLAYYKLQQIAALFNLGWKEDWDNRNQLKYYCYFDMAVSCGGLGVDCDSYCAHGSSVYFKDKKTAEYCGNTFKSIFMEFIKN
jgi:hypothetical protein